MYLKEPVNPKYFEGKYTKFRKSVKNFAGVEVKIVKIKKGENPKYGDVRDYTAVGELYLKVTEDEISKKVITFNLGWVLTPKLS